MLRLFVCFLAAFSLGAGSAHALDVCPDGSYVDRGPCKRCPDGSYVAEGARCIVTPKGTYKPSNPGQRRPADSPGASRRILCPDGTFVYGTRCIRQPDGSYVGG